MRTFHVVLYKLRTGGVSDWRSRMQSPSVPPFPAEFLDPIDIKVTDHTDGEKKRIGADG